MQAKPRAFEGRGPVHYAQINIKEDAKINCCFKHRVDDRSFYNFFNYESRLHAYKKLLDLLVDTEICFCEMIICKWLLALILTFSISKLTVSYYFYSKII